MNEPPQHAEGALPSNNAALVVVESLENRRWTEASSIPEMSASTSHDETLLAVAVPADRGITIRVERLADGELVANTGINYDAGDSFFVLDSERGLLHLTDERLDLVSWDPEPATETLLEIEPGQGLPSMALTADPNVVVVSAINSIGEGNGYLVNIDTKGIIEVPNVLHRSLLLEASDGRLPQHVLAAATYGDTGSQSTLQMIDVTTGEPVVTSDPIDMEPAQFQQGLSMLRANGAVGFSFNLPGHVIALNAISGETYEFEMPTGIEGVPENHWWHVHPSYDGTFFLTSPDFEPGSPTFFRLLTPNAEWIALPSNVPDIIPGASVMDDWLASGPDPSGVPSTPEMPQEHHVTSPSTPAGTPTSDRPSGDLSHGNCDFGNDILIMTEAGDLPNPGSTALMLDGNQLWLHCGDTEFLVGSGVESVLAGSSWPGAVLLTMTDGTLRGIDVITGTTGDFGPADVLADSVGPYTRPIFVPNAPWAAIPGNRELTDWRFIDLRTMESRLLSEEIGGVLPRSIAISPFAHTPQAAIFGFPGVPVLAGERQHALGPGGATPPAGSTVSELPFENAALVINGSLGNIRWIEVTNRSMMPAVISQDAELVAVEEQTENGFTVRVERLANGEVVAETGIDYGVSDAMLLLDDDRGLVHLSEGRLDLVNWDDGDVEAETLGEVDISGQRLFLAHTTDPDVVIAGGSGSSGESMGYLVDVSTGETIELPHMLHFPFDNFAYRSDKPVHHVMVAAPSDNGTRTTLQLIDVVTGDTAVTSEPVDMTPEELALQPATLRANGSLGLIFMPNGDTLVLDGATGDSFTMSAPDPSTTREWQHFPSPEADYLVIASGEAFVREVSAGGDWVPVTDESSLGFLPGTGS